MPVQAAMLAMRRKLDQGAYCDTIAVRGHDFYETPVEATQTLLRHQWLPKRCWDPCAGRGALTRVLRAAGHITFETDLIDWQEHAPGSEINTGVDFLAMRSGIECDAIVMNPPFKLFDPFVRQALTFAPLVCVFGRLMAIEGVGRSDYMDQHLTRVIAGKERLPMIHRHGYEGKKQERAMSPYAWFVFTALPTGHPRFSTLERVSWKLETSDARNRHREHLPLVSGAA
jgi:hypothetical protein